MKWEVCPFLLGMGLRTSGMRISTRAWYMRWSQVLIHLSTASFLHSANSCELGSRASISLMLLSNRINTDLESKSHAFTRELGYVAQLHHLELACFPLRWRPLQYQWGNNAKTSATASQSG